MKLRALLPLTFSGLILTACSSSNFTGKNINPELYNDYWAMHSVEGLHRVLKFQKNGAIKVYDYHCHHNGTYALNYTEMLYLKSTRNHQFTLFDSKKKPLSTYEIQYIDNKKLRAKQTFDKERPLILNYTHQKSAKPLCR